MTKQIDQIYSQMVANTNSMTDKFDDLKTRIGLNETRIQAAESIKLGATEIKKDNSNLLSLLIAAVGVIVAVIVWVSAHH